MIPTAVIARRFARAAIATVAIGALSSSTRTVQSYVAVGRPFATRLARSAVVRSRSLASALDDDEGDGDGDDDETVTYFSPNARLSVDDVFRDGDDDDATTIDGGGCGGGGNEYSFFDEAVVLVRAGSGGRGASTFRKGVGGQNGRPDGGDGGRGGDVVLVRDDDLNTLAGLNRSPRLVSSFRAPHGADGERGSRNGKSAPDVRIRVPPGTVVYEEREIVDDDDDNDDDEPRRQETRYETIGRLGSIDDDSASFVVARGGSGGEGSAVTGAGRGVRRTRASPEGGERRRLRLTLRIVADVALVGVPNAGKSTFLAAVTRAKPKIANYPFTTVVPNLGVWVPSGTNNGNNNSDGDEYYGPGLVLCDVPGLVAGASRGVGLGHAFLRHVERCRVVLHLVDAASDDPVADLNMLNREMLRYGDGALAKKPQIVAVNKCDVWSDDGSVVAEDWERGLRARTSREDLDAALREALPHGRVVYVSAKGRDRVDELMERTAAFVRKVKEAEEESERSGAR